MENHNRRIFLKSGAFLGSSLLTAPTVGHSQIAEKGKKRVFLLM